MIKLFWAFVLLAVGATLAGGSPSVALPTIKSSPGPASGSSPTPLPANAEVLPLDSSLLFVLDDAVNSRMARPNQYVRMHLKDALVLNGRTVASAGTPGRFRVVNATAAQRPDVDGSIDVYFDKVDLPVYGKLPIRSARTHWTNEMTSGQASTAGITDTIKDIFIPYHALYRAFRKGSELDLRPGTIVRVRTAATIDASKPGVVSIITPPPFQLNLDAPHSDYTPLPLATVAPKVRPTARPTLRPDPAASP
ncbi:MAG: hypothetical protein M3Z14_00210 [Candidatus Eremiobacteraeota bacterium]|nr:hypothetical protein [Candidatus Eremiobacteraeota bacterium]